MMKAQTGMQGSHKEWIYSSETKLSALLCPCESWLQEGRWVKRLELKAGDVVECQ